MVTADALRALEKLASEDHGEARGYDFVFLDPPYRAAKDYARVLEFLGSGNLLAAGGMVVAEHRRSFELPEQAGALQRYRVLRQGDAALSFYRPAGATGGEIDSAE